VNACWTGFVGATLEEALTRDWYANVHTADRARCADTYAGAVQARRPFELQFRLRRHDGAYRPVRGTGTPIERDGRFLGFMFGAVETPPEPNAGVDGASGWSADAYRVLAEAIPALVLATSREGEVEYCNRHLLEYCGTDLEGLRGAQWVDYIHPDDVNQGRSEFVRRIQDMRAFVSEYRIRRADGEYRWHLTQTAPVFDREGAFQGWLACSVDVDDRRRAEEDARLYAEEWRRASAAKDEFLGMVSHELRTPITTIYGNAQVLRRMGAALDRETMAASITDVEQEAIRLQQLVDNMFVLARIEGAEIASAEPVLLSRVVGRVVSEHRTRFPSRPIELEDEAGLEPVRGEAGYIEQTVRNLLANAEKYSAPGQPITVVLNRSDAAGLVRVLDRGSGIAPGDIAHTFVAFFRGPATADRVPGAGIGLTVCKRLVEAQGGEIWIRPRVGGGTEVGFTLPIESEAI